MTISPNTQKYDAIVVGARVAGASTAMLLARQGARVLVVDYAQPGSDTMSTHALMRGAVSQLRKWGVLDAIVAAGTPAVHRTTFIYGDDVIDVDIRPENGVDALYAPRRTVLDARLVCAAAEAGVAFRFGTGCTGLVFDAEGRVRGAKLTTSDGRVEEVAADIVIGADGRRSAVARQVGAETMRLSRNHIGCSYAYVQDLPDRGYRWHHDRGAAGGIIPTNDGLSCVFVALSPERLKSARQAGQTDPLALARSHLPRLAEELTEARMATRPVFYGGEPGYFRRAAGPGWALVGDAGYFRDPITAHGITDALRDAQVLADAVIAGRIADYPVLRDALSSEFFEITDRVAGLDWTLDELKGLHVSLNRAMKANAQWIAGMDGTLSLAA